jgi:hypothetical protein
MFEIPGQALSRYLADARVISAVQRSLVPSCAPAIEYVAMPDGSSSAAPVMMPGPSDLSTDRIQRDGAGVCKSGLGLESVAHLSAPLLRLVTAKVPEPP